MIWTGGLVESVFVGFNEFANEFASEVIECALVGLNECTCDVLPECANVVIIECVNHRMCKCWSIFGSSSEIF